VEAVNIPESMVSEAFIQDPSVLRGAIWRINVNRHGLITHDMMAFQPIYPTDRFHVLLLDAVMPSMVVGSYVDIRMITPDGIDFVVFSKMRVVNIYQTGIEVVLSEAQWMIYIGLLIDRFMHNGTVLYASVYVDPALQNRLYVTYIPPREIVDFMNVNRNMLFPYVEGTDVAGMRAFIESVQPWNRYGPAQFTTQIQAIRDRENRVVSAISSQMGAMNRSRQEFTQYMTAQYQARGEVWSGAAVGATQVGAAGSVGGNVGQQATQINPDGTWVDQQGNLRRPDGTPVIMTTDIIAWNPNTVAEAPLNDGGTQNWEPNIGG
jgi:hypothetical protein